MDAATRTHKVAIKLFRISPTDTDAEDVKRTARREAHLMESLSHPHIVNCKELFWIEDKVAIVMDFAPRNLLEALEEREQVCDRIQHPRALLWQYFEFSQLWTAAATSRGNTLATYLKLPNIDPS